jgi:hypothetical protein
VGTRSDLIGYQRVVARVRLTERRGLFPILENEANEKGVFTDGFRLRLHFLNPMISYMATLMDTLHRYLGRFLPPDAGRFWYGNLSISVCLALPPFLPFISFTSLRVYFRFRKLSKVF